MTIRSKLLEHAEMSDHIKSMLNNVHDNFSIKEIIDSEAYKSAALAFEEQLSEIREKINALALEKAVLDTKIKTFNNVKRTRIINDYFSFYAQ